MEEIRVVLIEDHDLTRVGLRAALQRQSGIVVIGEAANATQGLSVLEETPPDVAIVDIGLPDMDGIELTQRIKQNPSAAQDSIPKVLILTMHDSEEAILAAFAAGADSYCMKDIEIDRLTDALRLTYAGNSWIDPTIANVVLRQVRTAPAAPGGDGSDGMVEINAVNPEYEQVLETYPLTERELEVLELIVSGYSNAAIAEALYITLGTVKTHVRNILNKLCANDRTQAAVRALRSGLVH